MLGKKLLLNTLLIMSVGGMSFAHAISLKTINHTHFDSTSVMNNGVCSTILGDSGITPAGQEKDISDFLVKKACITNQLHCKADVYLTRNCSGPKVATVTLNVNTGIESVTMNNPAYQITYTNDKSTSTVLISG